MRGRTVRLGFALLSSLVGTALVFQVIDWMNRPPPPAKKTRHRAPVAFKVSKKRPPKVRQRTPPKQPPRRTRAQPRAPIPNLSTGLSGVSFGIPPIAASALGAAQDKLLGADSALRDVVMTARSVDQPPRATQPVSPSYPPRARAQGITGYVKMRLLVGADGAVQQVKVIDAKPRGVFDEAATAAIRQWRFSPARYRGQAVKLWVVQTLRFKLG
ncbi:MAG: energy transducer TonB [Myxococcales bacterium]|nr:energy transducer TonB [Myxococcales bacterium]